MKGGKGDALEGTEVSFEIGELVRSERSRSSLDEPTEKESVNLQ